jgi:hypothetical protein
MATVELTNQQVIDLVRQLPAQQKREALLALAGESAARSEARMKQAEDRLRHLAHERGLNWERMSEAEREALVDDLVHENRPCPS